MQFIVCISKALVLFASFVARELMKIGLALVDILVYSVRYLNRGLGFELGIGLTLCYWALRV